jgi:hypothetical protein
MYRLKLPSLTIKQLDYKTGHKDAKCRGISGMRSAFVFKKDAGIHVIPVTWQAFVLASPFPSYAYLLAVFSFQLPE